MHTDIHVIVLYYMYNMNDGEYKESDVAVHAPPRVGHTTVFG